MAERIAHDVTPPKIGPDAQEELDRLVQTLHEHGVLRFANDVVASNHELLRILVGGLNKPGTLNAIQNLSVIAMTLSTLPPERFYQVMFALKEGIEQVGNHRHDEAEGHSYKSRSKGKYQEKDSAPGITGIYRLLHDDELWYAIQPVLAGLRAFSERLDRPVDKPVTDFTGKPTEGP
ncbi:DUF1641 domain-containing protein [Vreelandella nanhaiensis]|uniref:DUF1641 domain-containing protein n=1 Tax=Vreelandella nanhaiensis TaxID=1258546 RepID=A0A3S0W5D8_9GAMM|nr:DUF1641 domain-containing protein [Halomonas nanhaiensis]RUR29056.1 DUF1641 domain-containing protein [Halomonas nanhaiensis]